MALFIKRPQLAAIVKIMPFAPTTTGGRVTGGSLAVAMTNKTYSTLMLSKNFRFIRQTQASQSTASIGQRRSVSESYTANQEQQLKKYVVTARLANTNEDRTDETIELLGALCSTLDHRQNALSEVVSEALSDVELNSNELESLEHANAASHRLKEANYILKSLIKRLRRAADYWGSARHEFERGSETTSSDFPDKEAMEHLSRVLSEGRLLHCRTMIENASDVEKFGDSMDRLRPL